MKEETKKYLLEEGNKWISGMGAFKPRYDNWAFEVNLAFQSGNEYAESGMLKALQYIELLAVGADIEKVYEILRFKEGKEWTRIKNYIFLFSERGREFDKYCDQQHGINENAPHDDRDYEEQIEDLVSQFAGKKEVQNFGSALKSIINGKEDKKK
jgi:hypothetical protein